MNAAEDAHGAGSESRMPGTCELEMPVACSDFVTRLRSLNCNFWIRHSGEQGGRCASRKQKYKVAAERSENSAVKDFRPDRTRHPSRQNRVRAGGLARKAHRP